MDGSFGDCFGVIVVKKIEDEVEVGLHFFEPGTLLEIILKAAVMPTSEIGWADGDAVFAEFCDDMFVREAIVEHGVDGFTEGFGESGNLAFPTMAGLTGADWYQVIGREV